MYKNHFYEQHAKNIHSQNGEDGIITEICCHLNINMGWACEFGAWDGMHLSNTFNLIKQGWNAVFIEENNSRYITLMNTCSLYPKIQPMHAFVDHVPGSLTSLDNLLKTTNIPNDFDVLSIDIDTFDYQVWDSLKLYKPKIVIIEINSSIDPNVPNHIHTPGVFNGTSFLPMLRLGQKKGYTFVLHTGNMIFVRNDLYPQLGLSYSDPLENFRINWLK